MLLNDPVGLSARSQHCCELLVQTTLQGRYPWLEVHQLTVSGVRLYWTACLQLVCNMCLWFSLPPTPVL